MSAQAGGSDDSDATTLALMVGVFDRARGGPEPMVDVLSATGAVRGGLDRARVELDMYRRDHLDPVRLRRVRQAVMRASHLFTFRIAAAVDALIGAVDQVDLVQRNQLEIIERSRASMRIMAVSTDQAMQDAADDIRHTGGSERADLLLSELDLLRERVEMLEQRYDER